MYFLLTQKVPKNNYLLTVDMKIERLRQEIIALQAKSDTITLNFIQEGAKGYKTLCSPNCEYEIVATRRNHCGDRRVPPMDLSFCLVSVQSSDRVHPSSGHFD